MTKKSQHLEINSFVGGLVTEVSLLDFPPNAMYDGENFVLNPNGSLDRRLGMDYEPSYALIDTGIASSVTNVATKTYRWRNVSGNANLEFIAMQVGSDVHFLDSGEANMTQDGYLGSVTVPNLTQSTKCSFTSSDGNLVIATGGHDFFVITYNSGVFSITANTLKVRDIWGVEDLYNGYNLKEDIGVSIRPTVLSDAHEYNLRNQSFGEGRTNVNTGFNDPLLDSITGIAEYPSNADSVWIGMDADDRFNSITMKKLQQGSSSAATGSFVIDVLNRGASRITAINDLYAKEGYPAPSITLPSDSTDGGAAIVEQFAGRVFYGGFSGNITDGDSQSPVLNSYILFSRLIDSPSDFAKCYQEGDPTSRDYSEILDDDGGFIRISGMRTLIDMAQIGDALILLADNGVWSIRGESGYGFTATSYIVNKISEYGVLGVDCTVSTGDALFYWSDNGIMATSKNQYGDFQVTNISLPIIQSFYNSISISSKTNAVGSFDKQDNTIRWVYDISTDCQDLADTKELIFDINLKAFYSFSINSNGPRLVNIAETPAFIRGQNIDIITSAGVTVTSQTVPVTITEIIRQPLLRSLKYVTLVDNGGTIHFSVAEYRDQEFIDWASHDSVGIDAKAFILTGGITAGQTNITKQAPYLFNYFFRTEDGFTEDLEGNLIPLHQSSCKVRVQWDFTSGAQSNRWSPLFQAYRYKREYYASGPADTYDTGLDLIMTRNKLRGRGKALSIYMETEALKDCRIVGWTLSLNGNAIG